MVFKPCACITLRKVKIKNKKPKSEANAAKSAQHSGGYSGNFMLLSILSLCLKQFLFFKVPLSSRNSINFYLVLVAPIWKKRSIKKVKYSIFYAKDKKTVVSIVKKILNLNFFQKKVFNNYFQILNII